MRKLSTRHSHKKASLEISVQAIVIVVLAMTLLGLGLGFVRNLFQDTTDLTTQVTDQIKGQILEDLRRGDKSLSFPTDQVTLGKSEEKILAIGIKNIGQTELRFKLQIDQLDDNGEPLYVDENGNSLTKNFDVNGDLIPPRDANGNLIPVYSVDPTFGEFLYANGVLTLKVTEASVYPIKFSAETTGEGTEIFIVKVIDTFDNTIYASKTFFIKVT